MGGQPTHSPPAEAFVVSADNGRPLGGRSDRVRSHQHHRIQDSGHEQETREGLPGNVEKARSGHIAGSRPGFDFGEYSHSGRFCVLRDVK